MIAENSVLLLVTQRLEAEQIPYMLSGSMALNFYGQPRMTRDVDLVVQLLKTDGERVVQLFEEDFSCDIDEIKEAIERERMFNLIHYEQVVKIDFIVRKSSAYRREEFTRRRTVDFGQNQLWIVSPEDLLLSKLCWAKDSGSDLQLRDVGNLVASVKNLDWSYIERWAQDLGVAKSVAELRP